MENPFAAMYRQGAPPWDIGQAQPALVELANAGAISGRVLEPGCGTGENLLEMAERGHPVLGFDIALPAIEQARAKAAERLLEAEFLVGDALEMAHLGVRFDTILDCGLFHIFDDRQRVRYEEQLRAVASPHARLHLMCFSDREDRRWGGPRRVAQHELITTFQDHWSVDDIQEARLLTRPGFPIRGHAWLASFTRLA